MSTAAAEFAEALDLLEDRRYVVLTGAGMSTDSGIPDYRGPRPAGAAPVPMPMTYQEFVASAANQQRYWARAHVGWTRMGSAVPNPGHLALAALTQELVITQNVDCLHERAGQADVVALHGRIIDVVCLDCRAVTGRGAVHASMTAANPGWLERHHGAAPRPDGDVLVEDTARFVVPTCGWCGGRLKPDVVFFGENVPKERVLRCRSAVDETDALLVLGSSLTVMSGLRFVRQAYRRGLPIVIVNRGNTRGDDLASVRVEAACTEFLAALEERTGRRTGDSGHQNWRVEQPELAPRDQSARTAMVGGNPARRLTTSSDSGASRSITA